MSPVRLKFVIYLGLPALLASCDRQESSPDVDPKLGRDCFENHRSMLPQGTQYEGIVKLVENKLTIRIMNGVEVITLDCAMNPDGTLKEGGN